MGRSVPELLREIDRAMTPEPWARCENAFGETIGFIALGPPESYPHRNKATCDAVATLRNALGRAADYIEALEGRHTAGHAPWCPRFDPTDDYKATCTCGYDADEKACNQARAALVAALKGGDGG